MTLLVLIAAACCATGPAAPVPAQIDLAADWRFQADPHETGEKDQWQAPAYDDAAWPLLQAGKRWEDQGFPEVDGDAWYRKTVEVPTAWLDRPVWLLLGAVNDSCVVYCNGTRVNSYGGGEEHSMHATPVIAELSSCLHGGAGNLVAIQCHDLGNSGGLWRLPCVLTVELNDLPLDATLSLTTDARTGAVTVDMGMISLGNELAVSALRLELLGRRSKQYQEAVAPGAAFASLSATLQKTEVKKVSRVRVSLVNAAGQPVAGMSIEKSLTTPAPPKWPAPYAKLKVRNSFVTELLNVPVKASKPGRYAFQNPRAGWVFFSASPSATKQAAPPTLTLDDQRDPMVWRKNPDTGAFESMQSLAVGPHTLALEAPIPFQLEVRTMPELAFCYYPCTPNMPAYGPYDWAYVSRYVLPHVNTLITAGGMPATELDQWRREGRHWISNAGLPGLSEKTAPTADQVYAVWAANDAVTKPGYSGLIVDEFLVADAEHYRAWGDAAQRLHETPGFAGKTFYAWCGDIHQQAASRDFCRLLMRRQDRFSWERYLGEEPTAAEARLRILREIQYPFQQWREALPGVERNMIVCLGYLCAPPESVNVNPAVDYHVFMDMQFYALANDPTFWNLYGIMEYSASYADEESLRWAHQLFRHYCIEGKRDRLTDDPYVLPHLRNPDFLDGLNHWQVEAAEPGAIDVQRREGFSWLQGRYPRTEVGDQFCRMERSTRGPNCLRQTLSDLKPGRLYSVKLIAADLQQLDCSRTLPLRVTVDDAEPLPAYGFQQPYASNYAHEFGPYSRARPAYFNFYRLVFRAKGTSARLTIADRNSTIDPGAPAGPETAFNFVEVQPFHEPK